MKRLAWKIGEKNRRENREMRKGKKVAGMDNYVLPAYC